MASEIKDIEVRFNRIIKMRSMNRFKTEEAIQLLHDIRSLGRITIDPILRNSYSQMATQLGRKILELTGKYYPIYLLPPTDIQLDEEKEISSAEVFNPSLQTSIANLSSNILTIEVAQAQLDKLPLDSIPAPVTLPPGSRISLSHNPLFVDREDELRELARILKAGDSTDIGLIAAATGLGGIGKTQLATEFVHRYGQYFVGGVFWLSFADSVAVPAEIAACGGLDGMRLSPDFDTLPLDEQVRRVLAEWRSSLPRLLVFDNCEDEELLDQWRPKYGGCRILVTSRRQQWDSSLGVHVLPLGVLPRFQSVALLRAFRWGLPEADADLDAIAAELGDLPLALHLAGSFLKRYQQDITAGEYLDELRATRGVAHESLDGAGISPTKHDLSVARTFRLSYDRLDMNVSQDALVTCPTCEIHSNGENRAGYCQVSPVRAQ